jgi:hypothetical protein
MTEGFPNDPLTSTIRQTALETGPPSLHSLGHYDAQLSPSSKGHDDLPRDRTRDHSRPLSCAQTGKIPLTAVRFALSLEQQVFLNSDGNDVSSHTISFKAQSPFLQCINSVRDAGGAGRPLRLRLFH